MTRFRIDSTWRRPNKGQVLLAGSPMKMFRLGESGTKVIEQIERSDDTDSSGAPLVNRLLDAGAIFPQISTPMTYRISDVTVVIPVHAKRSKSVADLNKIVAGLNECAEIIVVDDVSPYPIEPTHDWPDNCRVVLHRVNKGPGGARNTGLAEVATDLVAFIDVDTNVTGSDLQYLLSHFDIDQVGAVAPRIVGAVAAKKSLLRLQQCDLLARFEETESQLDLGDESARVRSGSRVSYVPSACLIARTSLIKNIGGFDESLRTGEDVDLVWRLDQEGSMVLYESAVVVTHAPRTTLRDWYHQRKGYGQSAAPLANRHPDALAPLLINPWSLGIWILVAMRKNIIALGIAGWTTVSLAKKLTALPNNYLESARLVALGHWHAGTAIAKAAARVWLPALLVASLFSKRLRRFMLGSAMLPPLIDWIRKRPRLDPVRYVVLRIWGDLAYAIGVWEGCIEHRNEKPLLPRITLWSSNDD